MNYLQQILGAFMTHFELILTITVLVCFIFYLIDGHSYRKTRKRLYRAFKRDNFSPEDRLAYAIRLATVLQSRRGVSRKHQKAFDSAQNKLTNGEPLSGGELYWLKHPVYPQEKFIEFFGGMFWVLFAVWFIRSFLWEPFRIPSGSMEPNLYDGDFILTSKYSYGIKLPVLRSTIIPTGSVQRGDVIVFRYPQNPSLHYIKRVIGLPGDHIRYDHDQVWINGEAQPLEPVGETREITREYEGGLKITIPAVTYKETLGGREHLAQLYPQHPNTRPGMVEGSLTVPEGHYFVMGDNRDDSEDSRAWGFVPEANLVGKATIIWMNSNCLLGKGECDHIGKSIH
ncbi:signal peptidase I [Cardiobacterium sp. Marseille-Q4385]|uniref:signal peptidase I n=1 Tax=Cardiobacterium sp. Marseille-Q4385 TaxID=2866573 RepID=UPI001CE43372|nr:signal peptidase I [Cardiobacterium sp. Marseille-Q4385]